jgi:hypothetical protein
MAECEKNKAGLQKKVSSVFKGVPVPQDKGAGQPSDTSAPGRPAEIAPKPASTDQQISQGSLVKRLNQPEESLDKAAPAKQPQSDPPVEAGHDPPVEAGHDPFVETTSQSFWPKIKDKLFAPKPGGSTTKQKAMVILVPVLAIVMIFMFRQVLSKAPRKTEGATNNDAPAPVVAADSGTEVDWQIPEPLPVVMRDPIKLPDETDTQANEGQNGTIEAPATIDIRDIVYSKDKPSAFINGQIVYVGDKVNDATIIKINRDSVEFERDEETWVQSIRE